MNRAATHVSALSLAEARSIAHARHWVRTFLDGMGADERCVEHAVLIASELTSNAIRHGIGEVVCELVWQTDQRCILTVIDFGPGTPDVVDREPGEIGGLGLVIVDHLAREWGVAPFDGGKAVFAVFDTRSDGSGASGGHG